MNFCLYPFVFFTPDQWNVWVVRRNVRNIRSLFFSRSLVFSFQRKIVNVCFPVDGHLYGCELWYLKDNQIKELERVLNVFCRMTQCLIPGFSGSAARGLLGLRSIKTEISKRKLYLLGRIINSSSSLARRKLFIRKLVTWKWKQNNCTMTGFVPDIIKLLVKANLFRYITEFLQEDYFPTKTTWKKIVKKAIYENDHCEWVDKIARKKELKFYRWSQPCITMSNWYDLWKYGHSKQIIDILRLLCGSLTLKKERFGNPGTLNGICSACQEPYNNAVHPTRSFQHEQLVFFPIVNYHLNFS